MPNSLLFLPNSHLFSPGLLPEVESVLMIEDEELCSRFAYHKKRLVFLIEAQRCMADELRAKGVKVLYLPLKKGGGKLPLEAKIEAAMEKSGAQSLAYFEIEDRFLRERIRSIPGEHVVYPSPLFLHTTEEFQEIFAHQKQPRMRNFYEAERKKRQILMVKGKPKGGQFSYDADNRKPLPASVVIPKRPKMKPSKHHQEVCALVEEFFPDHPGSTEGCWLPTTREGARRWLKAFIENCFVQFGPYEDAISPRDPFLFHSVLSPLINTGLLTPQEVLDAVLDQKGIPLNSMEGFVRQVMGWREFIRGIDECFGEKQAESNFFKHKRKLAQSWYTGETGIVPLDDVIKKVMTYGYCHHIERLMVISNCMLLCEIDPGEVYRWFMELFVDSADWVMGPNVYGMGQFSDGGIFATKPYICGSNYLLKMSSYKKGEWCTALDGLYWRFVDKHRAFFAKQPRLNMMTKTLDKMDAERKKELFACAEAFIKRHTR